VMVMRFPPTISFIKNWKGKSIIRKAVPEAFADGIEGIGLYPRSLSIPEFTGKITSKGGC
jgi:hypothetical protein